MNGSSESTIIIQEMLFSQHINKQIQQVKLLYLLKKRVVIVALM